MYLCYFSRSPHATVYTKNVRCRRRVPSVHGDVSAKRENEVLYRYKGTSSVAEKKKGSRA